MTGTVLVVDDEPGVRSVTARVLQRLGLRILEAADGREGVELFAAYCDEIQCVVLDLTMPEMHGTQAAQEMRRLAPHLPIVLMSGYNEQEALRDLDAAAQVYFLHKPFSPQELRQVIRHALEAEERSE
ncbi:response regulator [Scytonema tolypothrichoides VB-61278]|nr:response regulator [Scytonema tolypothrichoides VB-61278]